MRCQYYWREQGWLRSRRRCSSVSFSRQIPILCPGSAVRNGRWFSSIRTTLSSSVFSGKLILTRPPRTKRPESIVQRRTRPLLFALSRFLADEDEKNLSTFIFKPYWLVMVIFSFIARLFKRFI